MGHRNPRKAQEEDYIGQDPRTDLFNPYLFWPEPIIFDSKIVIGNLRIVGLGASSQTISTLFNTSIFYIVQVSTIHSL